MDTQHAENVGRCAMQIVMRATQLGITPGQLADPDTQRQIMELMHREHAFAPHTWSVAKGALTAMFDSVPT